MLYSVNHPYPFIIHENEWIPVILILIKSSALYVSDLFMLPWPKLVGEYLKV